jgi:hypothetical protein
MAEVRSVRVERVERVRREFTYTDKHSVGVELAVKGGSWVRGIEAREAKLGRIDKATEMARIANDYAITYARENGLEYWPGAAGMALLAARLLFLGLRRKYEMLKMVMPKGWEGYLDKVTPILLEKYEELRRIRV